MIRPGPALIGLTLSLFLAAAGRDALDDWVDATQLPPLEAQTSVEVLDRNNDLLRAYQVADGRWRLHASVANVDPQFLQMLVRFEDKRFYTHSGVDLVAMIRAAGQAAWNGKVVSGGSTLTMQVARLLEETGTGKWHGKLRQMRVALALERRLSKTEILSIYLRRAPYGGNLEGVRAATLAYFGKEPRRLTPAQSALLVALPQSPEARRPDRHPETALKARDNVLARLAATSALDPVSAKLGQSEVLPRQRRNFPKIAPHLTDRLVAGDALQQHETTVDKTLQLQMVQLARLAVEGKSNRLSVAILVADHQTGEILASVGSPYYKANRRGGFLDMTRAVRSPGSTLKPLIYGMAFDRGLAHPETLINDRPTDFNGYAPQNFDGHFRGKLPVREALQSSLNLPVVSLLEAMGPANLMAALRKAGTEPKLPGGQPGLAIALGGVGLSLHDLVQLYGMLAGEGTGVALSERPDTVTTQKTVLGPRSAWYVTDILSGITPPKNARRSGLAYKTGTSYGHRDAWAIGYDGQHVIGVWMGRPDGTPVPGAFGGDLAAPVLFKAFERLGADVTPLPAPPSDALLISNAELPQPLQSFKSRGQTEQALNHPKIAFPPNGAVVVTRNGEGVFVEIRDGVAPFTWLANGAPLKTDKWARQTQVVPPGPGFLKVTVIDARGQSAQTQLFVK